MRLARVAAVIGTYDYWLVVLSVLVATLASSTALELTTRITNSQGRSAKLWLLGGAFSMGMGIWSMHFIGMLAFSLPVPMGYDVPITLLSMVIAIIVSGFALYIVSRERLTARRLLAAGALMGLGIASMHYTGMAAMQTSPPIQYDPALFAASIAIAILASLAALSIAFALRTDSLWMIYAKYAAALVMGIAIAGMHYTAMAAANFAPDTICLTGPRVDNSWMAGTIAVITFLVLSATRVLSVFDANMAARTARMAARLQEANAELKHLVLHDPLTRLPNRPLLEDRIGQAIEACRRAGTRCAVLFVDLDRFKGVNDSLGHFFGDELLRTVAERLHATVRSEDTVSRLGGDEFVVLLREVAGQEDATVVAQKLNHVTSAPVIVPGRELCVTASVGVALFPEHGSSARTLITNADAAMYHVKKSGRNGFRLFTPDMSTFFPDRLALESDLRKALERRELELHYQPKFDVGSGAVSGMEALARWRHPTRGLVPPAEFIPLAEESGLIVSLGHWVLREACRQNKAWQDQGLAPLRVAVNISGTQLREDDLADSVALALRESGLPARFLELEITESVVMQNASSALLMLERLSQMGIHLAVDDFGTGYSSLSYLHRFPINTLKIDRSFIHELSTNRNDALIVQAIIALAHSLKLEVVAEGVEDEGQLAFLKSFGSDQFQGYLRSRPLPALQFQQLLAHVSAEPATSAAAA
ncbi:MAG TPA: EAL domain-containing protein [Burkholderiales bacterium]|nr:EAL domain-containing protein [Burkholderiales bacterium]